ncbi:metallophosphoesterase [Staphylococcus coagulans]|uniref:Phosphoesterase n=1 Tax=Staphylococcus coagulans TaxID=74706 RepID=A0A9X1EBF5_9STAP|nr:metallophosphoesterase [Staphylococcus coagulans]MBA8775967.1 metallophosphoesterase [Staphylococcus coagulans]MBT2830126.1 metallophosphoesterase [Staphylococcus coagulans]MBT2859268.1 metallophosphoesterase [Staphylococcus coagulans]MBU3873998.1 metallophosphoesterase [Staphylococcus coagulans]
MKKLIVASDNHSESGILYQIYEEHQDADAFYHLGDSEFAYQDTELSLYHRVKGNMDFYPEFPESQADNFEEANVFYTHGHLFGVNRSRVELAYVAAQHQATIAFYGHTHVARYEKINDVHVINPGSISQSRSDVEETYAEVIIDGKDSEVRFRNRDHKIIETIPFEL